MSMELRYERARKRLRSWLKRNCRNQQWIADQVKAYFGLPTFARPNVTKWLGGDSALTPDPAAENSGYRILRFVENCCRRRHQTTMPPMELSGLSRDERRVRKMRWYLEYTREEAWYPEAFEELLDECRNAREMCLSEEYLRLQVLQALAYTHVALLDVPEAATATPAQRDAMQDALDWILEEVEELTPRLGSGLTNGLSDQEQRRFPELRHLIVGYAGAALLWLGQSQPERGIDLLEEAIRTRHAEENGHWFQVLKLAETRSKDSDDAALALHFGELAHQDLFASRDTLHGSVNRDHLAFEFNDSTFSRVRAVWRERFPALVDWLDLRKTDKTKVA